MWMKTKTAQLAADFETGQSGTTSNMIVVYLSRSKAIKEKKNYICSFLFNMVYIVPYNLANHQKKPHTYALNKKHLKILRLS